MTIRGLPDAFQATSISESGIVCIAIWSLAGAAASKTFLMQPSSFISGTLFIRKEKRKTSSFRAGMDSSIEVRPMP